MLQKIDPSLHMKKPVHSTGSFGYLVYLLHPEYIACPNADISHNIASSTTGCLSFVIIDFHTLVVHVGKFGETLDACLGDKVAAVSLSHPV